MQSLSPLLGLQLVRQAVPAALQLRKPAQFIVLV
jgi:hypothetical protein